MHSPNGIKAILFDFDGTLRHHIPAGGDVFTDYVVSLGYPVTQEDRLRAARWEHFYFANSPEIQADHEKFGDEDEAFWFNFSFRRLAALGISPVRIEELGPKASAHMAEAYKPEVWMPEEVHTVLPEFKEAGYILGVVSNRDQPYQEHIEEMGLQDYFHFSLAAGEVQSWKPDTKIFEHACKMAGTPPEQTLYIGDNYFADVVGSRRAGLHPVLFDLRGVFLNPDCPVIASFNELTEILK